MSETMNRSNYVTHAQIANRLGLSRATVCNALKGRKEVAPNTADLVRKTAQEMGYDHGKKWGNKKISGKKVERALAKIDAALPTLTRSEKTVSMEMIANKLGISCTTVQRVYASNGKKVNEKIEEKIRQAADILGYIPGRNKKHNGKDVAVKWWWGGNFHTKEEEVSRMLDYRKAGFTNAEIAKKLGRSRDTVDRHLGKQDAAMTAMSCKMAGLRRAQQNAARKQYAINKPILEYNAKVEEHNTLKAKLEKMEAEIAPQTPHIEKICTQKIDIPALNLKTLQPTQIM